MVQLLLDYGAEHDKQNEFGLTSLHFAVLNSNTNVVKLLVESGADVQVANIQRQTPLHMAAWIGQKEMVQALLDGGADPNKEDDGGRTPLSNARSTRTTPPINGSLAMRTEIVEMLTDAMSRQKI